jgi:hypothetical protein
MHRLTFADWNPSCVWRLMVVGFLVIVLGVGGSEAKTKRLDNKIVDTAEFLAKDRESAFSGDKALPLSEFQYKWEAFVKQLDETYLGHKIKLTKFGTDVRLRKVFSHLLYLALRVQQKSALTPTPQELVGRHPFLQELMLDGACYTGGDAFPKKMKDLLKANPEMQFSIRDHLDKWDSKYRKQFEKAFGKAG